MKNCKVVLLDVDNTLLDFNMCAAEALKDALSEWDIPFTEEMFPVFLSCNKYLWEQIEKSTLTKEELYKIRFRMIFDTLGISGPEPSLIDARFREGISQGAVPIRGAHELLSYLSKKYTVCVASNASHARQVNRLTKANMIRFVEHVFSSEEIGHPKPEKAFFDACLARLGNVSRDEVVMIGDSLTADIAGGAQSGIKTIWFNYNHEPLPEEQLFTYAVENLEEIQDIL